MAFMRGRVWLIVVVISFLLLSLGAAGSLSVQAFQSATNRAPVLSSASAVGETIGYQGVLLDAFGNPLTGTYEMAFVLYDAPSMGNVVHVIGSMNVDVEEGLFHIGLNVPQSVFDGQALWLNIVVEGETLVPRQEIRPAPYAMSLRPGAVIRNAATGTALRVESEDVALYAVGGNFAVYGLNEGAAQGSGYGGYFTSTTGIGVHGGSSAQLTVDNLYAPGVYGTSAHGVGVLGEVATGFAMYGVSGGAGVGGSGQAFGVYGESSATTQGSGYGGYFTSNTGIGVSGRSTALLTGTNLFAPGVYGTSTHGVGVLGEVATGVAVYGVSAGIGTGGTGQVYGVFGESSAITQGSGYGGYFTSSTGIGVSGRSTALLTGTNLFAPGVYGYSQRGAGVHGEAGPGAGSVAGLFSGNLVVEGDIVATGSKAGYVVDIARNDDSRPLEQGDVVVVTGVADAVIGDIPVPLVHSADAAGSTAVIGVVSHRYVVTDGGHGARAEGTADPGEYVAIVTLGAFQAIKVDASYGAIQPGDLLVSSPTPGHAMRAENPSVGSVIGKAMGALDEGTGIIAVMVSLQ